MAEFDFGASFEGSGEVQRMQLASPLDVTSRGLLRNYVAEIFPELSRVQTVTLRSGDTAFEVRGTDTMSLTAAAAVSISTISNGYNGQLLTLIRQLQHATV